MPKLCGICMEWKRTEEIFSEGKCSHSFCSSCISKHVEAKIQAGIMVIKCPETNCDASLEPHMCQTILPKDVSDRWGDVLCESAIPDQLKYYCPYVDCSKLMLNDGREVIREAECLYCCRLFCAQCKTPWHPGINCEEFCKRGKKLEEIAEELKVIQLAETNKWRRCPSCKHLVEKIAGCVHMTCRCGSEFCYGCGANWSTSHSSNCQGA